jgi:hypothetical protein
MPRRQCEYQNILFYEPVRRALNRVSISKWQHFFLDLSAHAVAEGGSGGSGIPSANNAPLSGGNGGSGMPSADSTLFPRGGSGGSGIPSATSVCVVLFVALCQLTEKPAGTTMDPTNSVKPESKATFLKRIGDTSRCHPLRCPAKTIFVV